jgi:hypothetical protein
MQKYLWAGAAVIVVAAAGVYVACDYFLRHPESVIARAANALGTAAVYSNPLSVMNRSTTGTDAVRQNATEVTPVTVVKPVLEGEETIEPIQVEVVTGGPVAAVQSGAVEECDWQPCQEPAASAAPKPMPYAEVDPNEVSLTCPIERLIEAIAKAGEEACDPPVAGGCLDESMLLGLGFCDAEAIEVMPEEEAADDDTIEPPVPETAEPSYYHHHYEGCTRFSDGCPYPQMAPQSPVEIPSATKKPVKIKKVHKDVDKALWDGLMRTSERRSFCPPMVDTMEFRPSDAGNYPVFRTGPF